MEVGRTKKKKGQVDLRSVNPCSRTCACTSFRWIFFLFRKILQEKPNKTMEQASKHVVLTVALF